jgi:hypothetical protein
LLGYAKDDLVIFERELVRAIKAIEDRSIRVLLLSTLLPIVQSAYLIGREARPSESSFKELQALRARAGKTKKTALSQREQIIRRTIAEQRASPKAVTGKVNDALKAADKKSVSERTVRRRLKDF